MGDGTLRQQRDVLREEQGTAQVQSVRVTWGQGEKWGQPFPHRESGLAPELPGAV